MPVELYEHQKIAVEQLKNGSILCGGVGTGKSRTALAYYYLKECRGKIQINGTGGYAPMKMPRDLYIITPAKKRDTLEWEQECSPFLLSTNPELSCCGIKVTVDSWNNISKYCNVCGAFFIFDEQKVSGSGKWVRSFLQITKKNHWILLSATPGDTWIDYIPVFIANGYYKNRTEFMREHVVFSRFSKYPKIERYLGLDKLIRLKNNLIVDMVFVKPTIMHHETVSVGYDKELYRTVLKDRWNPYEDRPIKNVSELCYLMRRVSNSSQSRIEAAKKEIYKNPRLIIFYNFDFELEILRQIGKDFGITVAELNSHKHMSVPKGSKWIYLVQYASGAEAWNCIETNAVMLYSLNYSYKATVQAEGRIDRLNSPFSDLYSIRLVSSSSIDLAISRALENKEDFNEGRYFKI